MSPNPSTAESLGHTPSIDDCIDRLTKGISDGSLFTDFVKDPLDVIGCIAIVVGSIMHQASNHDDNAPIVFAGEQPPTESKIIALAEALKINVDNALLVRSPSGELVAASSGAIIKILAPIILPQIANILKKLIYDWLEKNRPAVETPIA